MTKDPLWNVGVILACLWLMSKPNCNAGCQTVLGHLLDHELGRIF